ncbi:Seryl-tRNA synthetase [Candidatus Karelsulcia muelleri]|uniref:Serine--tRNA ligase n=1 Tax=Candidatus Karelsulcia muelleri TaxID=336810 RepID=A0A654M608_9FLAO|nr:serine--tRNA ligase [Candidatus Karelsulcia muelleri]AGS33328.1 Seryl-tRNA synthetase [Candidatus Karelsulcia muelleri str. Sulcia-ALF]ALP70258.1 Seryl-tRNA synthetase [Candidatus Karelsulcia muelleri]QND78315.1 Serine--tRNA ligase [Candidatus Karelsulcia muelleri]
MLKVSFLERNKKIIMIGLIKRNFYKVYLINYILFLYNKRKKIKSKLDNLIYYIKYFSKKRKLNEVRNYSSFLKEKLKINLFLIKKIKNKIFEIIIKIPNFPFEEVKKNYKEILYKREILNNYKKKIDHWELGEKFKLFSTKKGAIISGNGFNVFINKGALLQRSLIQFFLEKNISSGYIEYVLPYIVNINSVYGTGQIPDKKSQMYNIDNLYLIPTGEVPLINIFKNNIFKESELPIKATTYTSCFRRESGSYGSKVRGLNRLHQFDKVEIIQISTCQDSYLSFNDMVNHIKYLLRSLNLPFRIIRLCGKDLGFTSALTYDFEVYSPGQKKWLEVSSVSNCTNFQSNRLKLRYRTFDGKIKLCHTLNGSSLAIPRIISAILENNQYKNYIILPKVLIKYMKIDKIY